MKSLFLLDPSIVFLNHGSFGACPRAALEHQSRLRAEMESEPVRFLVREIEDRLDAARAALARLRRAMSTSVQAASAPAPTSRTKTIARSAAASGSVGIHGVPAVASMRGSCAACAVRASPRGGGLSR